jgi:hypothetical protein
LLKTKGKRSNSVSKRQWCNTKIMLEKEIMGKWHIRQSIWVIVSYKAYHTKTYQRYEYIRSPNETLLWIFIVFPGKKVIAYHVYAKHVNTTKREEKVEYWVACRKQTIQVTSNLNYFGWPFIDLSWTLTSIHRMTEAYILYRKK